MGEEEAGDRYHDDDRDPWSSSLPVVVCKGKRSKRQRVHAAPPPPAEVVVVIVAAGAEAESSSADAGWRSGAEEEEEDMALCLMLLARGRGGPSFVAPDAAAAESTAKKEGKFRSRRPADGGGAGEFVYECRTCGRCFPSFQALGGHRTSHNKPRLLLLTAATSDEERRTPSLSPSRPSPAPHATADPTALAIPAVPATPPKHETSTEIDVSRRRQQPQQQGRVHECSICGAEFASGQALGGHMRRHRPLVVPASAASSSDDLAAIRIIKEKSLLELDLNMPAPCDEDAAETTSRVAPTHVGAGGGLPLLASKAKQSGRGQ